MRQPFLLCCAVIVGALLVMWWADTPDFLRGRGHQAERSHPDGQSTATVEQRRTTKKRGDPCYPPEAEPLPPPGVVSVSTQRQEGRVCLVIHNGTQTPIHYDRRDNWGGKSSLERHVLGHLWAGVRYATLAQWWRDLWQIRTLQMIGPRSLHPQATRSYWLRHPMQTFPAGQYRACFQYRIAGQRDWREACSLPFRHG